MSTRRSGTVILAFIAVAAGWFAAGFAVPSTADRGATSDGNRVSQGPPSEVRPPRRQPAAPEARAAQPVPAGPAGGDPSAVSLDEPASALPWLPGRSGARLVLGEAGNLSLAWTDWLVVGNPIEPGADRTARAAVDDSTVALLRRHLARRAAMPRASWDGEFFHAIGVVSPGAAAQVVGRAFALPASPESSLAWWEARRGRLGGTGRERALALLTELERARREVLVELSARVLELSATKRGVTAHAYMVTPERLQTVATAGEVAIEEACDAFVPEYVTDFERAKADLFRTLR